jgi:hypothetical protein
MLTVHYSRLKKEKMRWKEKTRFDSTEWYVGDHGACMVMPIAFYDGLFFWSVHASCLLVRYGIGTTRNFMSGSFILSIPRIITSFWMQFHGGLLCWRRILQKQSSGRGGVVSFGYLWKLCVRTEIKESNKQEKHNK